MNEDPQPRPEPTTDPKAWLEFVGCIPKDDLDLMSLAIESDCETVDPSE